MLMTRHGSCHCGAVKFACEIDLAPAGERSPQLREGPWFASTLRCNCSFCRKTRMWKSHVPAEAYRLLQGADNLSHIVNRAAEKNAGLVCVEIKKFNDDRVEHHG